MCLVFLYQYPDHHLWWTFACFSCLLCRNCGVFSNHQLFSSTFVAV